MLRNELSIKAASLQMSKNISTKSNLRKNKF
jgi:hypothetical protein